MNKRLLGVLVLALAAGCSRLDFGGPGMSPGKKKKSRKDGAAPAQVASSEARSDRLAEVLSEWNREGGSPKGEYRFGANDVVEVSVYALEDPQQTTRLTCTIDADGYISLPWVSNVLASAATVRELEDRVKAAYADRYIRNPQVTVQVKEYRSAAVLMTGAVRSPGIYYLTTGNSTLLDMLAKAGGLNPDAADEVLVIRRPPPAAGAVQESVTNLAGQASAEELPPELLARGGPIASVSLSDLIDRGDLRQNVEVAPGDIVTVRSRAQRFIYVLGYVGSPGAFDMRTSDRLDALRAVALAGGLSPLARAENSFIIREAEDGQTVIPVDLIKIARGNIDPVYMEAGDTLVVGSGFFARISEFVRPTGSFGVNAVASPLP